MSRSLSSSVLAELSASNVRWMFMVDLQLDSGSLAFNGSLTNYVHFGKTFYAAGHLGSVGQVTEGTSLDPSSCPITITGIDASVLTKVLNEDILNRRGIVYIAILDEQNQIIGDPFIYFDGIMQTPSVSYGSTSSISINLVDRLAVWNRKKTQLLTNEEQLKHHPTDKGFEYVNGIAKQEIVWPAARWFEVNK